MLVDVLPDHRAGQPGGDVAALEAAHPVRHRDQPQVRREQEGVLVDLPGPADVGGTPCVHLHAQLLGARPPGCVGAIVARADP